MKCVNCNKEINDDSIYCNYCGASQEESLKEAMVVASSEAIAPIADKIASAGEEPVKVQKRNKLTIALSAVLALLLIAAGLFCYRAVATFTPKKINRLSDSVVKIEVYDKNGNIRGTGSGIIAFRNDVVITNYHVVDGDTYSIQLVSNDNQTCSAKYILQYDAEKDIAILGLGAPTNITPVKIGDMEGLKIGQSVLAIGSPLGLLNTASTGIISALPADKNDIQITAPITHGSSGGALFNTKGELIGVTYAGYDEGQNLNLAIPITYATKLWDSYANGMNEESSQTIGQFYDNFVAEKQEKLVEYINAKDNKSYIEAISELTKNEDIVKYVTHQLEESCDNLNYNSFELIYDLVETFPYTDLAYNLSDYYLENLDKKAEAFLIGKWELKDNSDLSGMIVEVKYVDDELKGIITSVPEDATDYYYGVDQIKWRNFSIREDGSISFVDVVRSKKSVDSYTRTIILDYAENTLTISTTWWETLYKRAA